MGKEEEEVTFPTTAKKESDLHGFYKIGTLARVRARVMYIYIYIYIVCVCIFFTL